MFPITSIEDTAQILSQFFAVFLMDHIPGIDTEVTLTTLPRGALEVFHHRRNQTLMSIRSHALDPVEASGQEIFEDLAPTGSTLGIHDIDPRISR